RRSYTRYNPHCRTTQNRFVVQPYNWTVNRTWFGEINAQDRKSPLWVWQSGIGGRVSVQKQKLDRETTCTRYRRGHSWRPMHQKIRANRSQKVKIHTHRSACDKNTEAEKLSAFLVRQPQTVRCAEKLCLRGFAPPQ